MARYGMAGNYYQRRKQTNMLNLGDMPDHRSEYQIDMSDMRGGLNLKDLPYKLKPSESPKMENLWWEDGALCCRDGQSWYIDAALGKGISCYERLFHDYAFVHIGTAIYFFNPRSTADDYRVMYRMVDNVAEDRGAWFTYGDFLLYKNRGGYYRFQYDTDEPEKPRSRSYYKQKLGEEMTLTKAVLDKVTLYPTVVVKPDGSVEAVGDPVEKRWTAARAVHIGWYYTDGTDVFKLTDCETDSIDYFWKFRKVETETVNLFQYSLPAEFCYTPIMYINCTPMGAGDSYQPENRLSPSKTFWYTAGGNGTVRVDGSKLFAESAAKYSDVILNSGKTMDTGLYGFEATVDWYRDSARTQLIGSRAVSYFNLYTGTFVTSTPEAVNANTTLYWSVEVYDAVDTYRIPLRGGVGSVDKVIVYDKNSMPHEGTEGGSGDYDFTVTQPEDENGYATIKFNKKPPVTTPATANTVRITVTKENKGAYSSIMDCNRAITYGGANDAVIVMGNCPAQPNAYFWNGNNVVMDPGYFPLDHYNLGGGSDEYITQFGKQQGNLIIFKEHSIGKCSLSSTSIGLGEVQRVYLTLDYTAINHKVGCDIPWSVQLCENNLVFADSRVGVYILLDSSSAYENNVLDLSDKIEGTPQRDGMFEDVRKKLTDGGRDDICSRTGNRRYWLTVGDHTWVWDYDVSTYKDPSWFLFTGIKAVGYFDVNVELYDALKTDTGYFSLTPDGKIIQFDQSTNDFGKPIPKLYRTSTMNFGTYDRLKDVTSVTFALMRREKKRNIIEVEYGIEMDNDTEERTWKEPYPVNQDYGIIDRRKPNIKRCHHFYIELTNELPDCDMSVSAMQVGYMFAGRQRGNGR